MTARRIFLVWGFLSLAMIYGVHVPGQAMAFSPEAQNLFEQSRFEMDDGNYKDALELIDKALEIDATIPEYLFTRGQILIRLERYDEAEAQLLPIKDNAVFIELGALYAKRGRYRQSIEAYTKALAAFPTRADLYLARGKVFIELKEDSRAEADILKAAEVRPTLKIASLFHLALLKYKREDFEGAKAKLDEAPGPWSQPGDSPTDQKLQVNDRKGGKIAQMVGRQYLLFHPVRRQPVPGTARRLWRGAGPGLRPRTRMTGESAGI